MDHRETHRFHEMSHAEWPCQRVGRVSLGAVLMYRCQGSLK